MQGREAPPWAFSARVLWGDKGTERYLVGALAARGTPPPRGPPPPEDGHRPGQRPERGHRSLGTRHTR